MIKGKDGFLSMEAIFYGIAVIFSSLVIECMYPNSKIPYFDEFIEESVKMIALIIFFKLNKDGSWKNKVLCGGILGLTFGTIETMLGIFNETNVIKLVIYRTLFTNPMHVFVGILMAYYLIRNNSLLKIKGLVVAFFYHGIFNYAVGTDNIIIILLVICLLGLSASDKVSKISAAEAKIKANEQMKQLNEQLKSMFIQ